jgi:hypothetical protein
MKIILQFGVIIYSILSPIIPVMVVTGLLILIDTVVGVYRAWKLREPITSRKFGNVISKMLLYQVAIFSGFMIEVYIIDSIIPITRVIAGVITFTELFSILENISKITNTPIVQKIKKILNRKAKENEIF